MVTQSDSASPTAVDDWQQLLAHPNATSVTVSGLSISAITKSPPSIRTPDLETPSPRALQAPILLCSAHINGGAAKKLHRAGLAWPVLSIAAHREPGTH